MPPPTWLLLDRCVDYSIDESSSSSSSSPSDDEPSLVAALKSTWGAAGSRIPAPHIISSVAMLATVKPDAVAALPHPPEIATYTLRASSKSHRNWLPSHSLVACADKGLLVLYAGNYYGPGSSTNGCYLIHDTSSSSSAAAVLSMVPPPPETRCLTRGFGFGAAVVRLDYPAAAACQCQYLLAELAITPQREFPDEDPDAALLLWRSDERRWARKEVHLPREVTYRPRAAPADRHLFHVDTSFAGPGPGPGGSGGGSTLCWVDLLHGIVVCANPHEESPALRFVPLPADGCPAFGTSDYQYRPRVEECRGAACVGGRVRVVAMVGELEGWDSHQFRLTTWTLSSSPDLDGGGGEWRWHWEEDGVFPLEDLWATPEYRALGMPPRTPQCPVPSAAADEDGVVYAVVNDVEERDVVQGGIRKVVVRTELFKFRHQYVLGIDVRRNRIVSTSSGVPPESLVQMTRRLLPFDICSSASMHAGVSK